MSTVRRCSDGGATAKFYEPHYRAEQRQVLEYKVKSLVHGRKREFS